MDGPSALLRSYDSRKEPPPEVSPTIWQAGRATSATGLAFKPIQIGQIMYIDEGAGKYNPTPQILDEAVMNEWPTREVGLLVSIGTGKRPHNSGQNQSQWWESALGGTMGEFAEAKRRLMAKIEGCEATHQYMLGEHLARRNVDSQNYIRLNVEVGVGEYGMNEWRSLTSISTNTRQYLAKAEVQNMNTSASAKLARIHRAKIRHDRVISGVYDEHQRNSWEMPDEEPPVLSHPNAVELPTGPVYEIDSRPATGRSAHQYEQFASTDDKFAVISSDELRPHDKLRPPDRYITPRHSGDRYSYHSAQEHQTSANTHKETPPPLPPKTPLQPQVSPMSPSGASNMPQSAPVPPSRSTYPDYDAPPPAVNMSNKPQYASR